MKHLIFFIVIMCFSACSNAPKETPKDETKDIVAENVVKIDSSETVEVIIEDTVYEKANYAELVQSPQFFLPEEVAILQQYFNDSTIVIYDSSQVLLIEAKTDTAFNKAYLNLVAVMRHLSSDLYNIEFPEQSEDSYYPDYVMSDFEPIDEAVLGIHGTCVAECTDFDFTLDLAELQPLALKTTGTIDDLLFEILTLADGDFGGTGMGWHNWFVRTWDYGGGTLFGTGIHLDFLQKEHELKGLTSIFDELLKIYHNSLISDIHHGIYTQTKDEVIAELKEIIALEYISNEDKTKLNTLLLDIETGDGSCEKCVDKVYQFNCQTGDCNWGG